MSNSSKQIRNLFRDCFENYHDSVRAMVPEFPKVYAYPDGNPVRPVLPIVDAPKKIMLIGAFPSARFETRDGKLIPIGDNLSPFGKEKYFDGRLIRTQASREILEEHYFPGLRLDPNELWITDLVKIYLLPEKHIKNCRAINPNIPYVNTHKLFPAIAKASHWWLEQEIYLCQPKIIITLGEVVARVVSGDTKTNTKELLDGQLRPLALSKFDLHVAHLGHPEIWRRDANGWRLKTDKAIRRLATQLR